MAWLGKLRRGGDVTSAFEEHGGNVISRTRTCTAGTSVAATKLTLAVENTPEGCPRLAALVDSNENFLVYRSFGYLQARILLNKQDELRELEGRLDHLDSLDARDSPNILKSRLQDRHRDDQRKSLLFEIEEKFREYGTTGWLLGLCDR